MPQTRIGIGSDHAGFRLKEAVKRWLIEHSYPVREFGTAGEEACDYPDFAVANKFPHLRAAVCHDPTTARFSRAHNDANVLTLGSRITGEMVALDIVNAWLHTPFEGGRHSRRLAKIEGLASLPPPYRFDADDRHGGS